MNLEKLYLKFVKLAAADNRQPRSPQDIFNIADKMFEQFMARREALQEKPASAVSGRYRWVKPGEVLQQGDEFFLRDDREWAVTSEAGRTLDSNEIHIYRRRVTAEILAAVREAQEERTMSEAEAAALSEDAPKNRPTVEAKSLPPRSDVAAITADTQNGGPGDGWRWVEPGEVLEIGDEVYTPRDGVWSQINRLSVGRRCVAAWIRRRVTEAATEASTNATAAAAVMSANEIVERIMTAHWDLAACPCWVCTAGRKASLSPREPFLPAHGRNKQNYPVPMTGWRYQESFSNRKDV